jgi:chromosome segregation ATPase
MDLNETITIQSIITISLAVITILNFFSTRGRSAKEDTNKETENRVKVNMKLDQLCSQSNDLQLTVRENKKEYEKMMVELTSLSSRYDSYFKRIDEHETRIKTVEDTQGSLWKHVNDLEKQKD